ncbi:MAG TPA: response regulator [Polyangiaceae bacterium]|jgi:CheY-like chemotaxis protein|nr:response regulator [Polyangiaceae bacterium]
MREIHILLVEDSPTDRLLTVAAIEDSGLHARVHSVSDGIDTLAFLRGEHPFENAPKPDLVLLDLNLPRMDGRALLHRIKNDPKLRQTPVIVLTTSQSEDDINQAYAEHANSYVTKPMDQAEFSKAMAALGAYWIDTVTLPTHKSGSQPAQRRVVVGDSSATGALRVLIIEDNETDALLLRQTLKTSVQGANITHVDRLARAKEALGRATFDVIVMDLGLPDSVGLEGVHSLQRSAPQTPIVVLTGVSDEELGREALRAGAQDYLVKGEISGTVLARSIRYAIERQSLNSQLVTAQRMLVLGQLAGGVAHDFNNLLTIIANNAELVPEPENTDARELKNEIRAAVQRGVMLTRQLLAVGRKRVAEVGTIDVNALIQDSAKLLRRTLGDVRLNLELSPHLPTVHGDAAMLEQVLMNLAVNARDAMPRGGTLTVTTDTLAEIPADASRLKAMPSKSPCVRLRVIDSGEGIPESILARIWDPFFTTKGAESSTGLGLATVRSIIEQHNGDVRVDSKQGVGTTFTILLPPSPTPSLPARAHPEPSPKCEGRRILIVDDEMAILQTCKRFLERDKHTVMIASSGEAALALWEREQGRFDLVLTDMQMPDGIGGRELGQRLRAIAPALPIVYASGYSRDLLTNQMGLERGLSFIDKPYTPDELRTTVNRALTQPARDSRPAPKT